MSHLIVFCILSSHIQKKGRRTPKRPPRKSAKWHRCLFLSSF